MLNDDSTMMSTEEEISPTAPGGFAKPSVNLGGGSGEGALREKKVEMNVGAKIRAMGGDVDDIAEAKRFSAREKGKGKADLSVPVAKKSRVVAIEKENQIKTTTTTRITVSTTSSSSSSSSSSSAGSAASAPSSNPKTKVETKKGVNNNNKPASAVRPPSATGTNARVGTKLLPPSKGGPRRVPIDSAEAAPVGWRG
jgi:hypothetical protein